MALYSRPHQDEVNECASFNLRLRKQMVPISKNPWAVVKHNISLPNKHESLTPTLLFNVGPASQTLGQHQTTVSRRLMFILPDHAASAKTARMHVCTHTSRTRAHTCRGSGNVTYFIAKLRDFLNLANNIRIMDVFYHTTFFKIFMIKIMVWSWISFSRYNFVKFPRGKNSPCYEI